MGFPGQRKSGVKLEFDPEKHEYRLDGFVVPSVTQVLKELGLINARWYTEESRQRGNAVHAACHYLDDEELDYGSLDPIVVPYVRAYEKYKLEREFEPQMIEAHVFDPVYKYAGTLDRTGEDKDGPILLDLKTGAVNWVTGLQTAGYDRCIPWPIYAGGKTRCRRRIAVQLNNDGNYKIHEFKDRTDDGLFLSALALATKKRNGG